ncbi:MAG: peptide chain release factor N(5)-glutamine methyltransferase [Rhodocyclaceae bacterium]|nr:peptide chain release factor N(5)-glutamine methyltransferase [Rhodocyclaceae bacterium]
MTTIAEALRAAREMVSPAEARLLLRHVLGCTAAWLETHRDDILDEECATAFSLLAARRAGGAPVAYLLGRREFYGREFEVSPAVLIPRPETELLVDLAVARLRGVVAPRILDLGTGSGCIAVTLALEIPEAEVVAIDRSVMALAMAEGNAERLGGRVLLAESDWFSDLAEERFNLIVSNPPYISTDDPHLHAGDLRHEPLSALASGSDGLGAIRRICAEAAEHLCPGGVLLFEHGYDQAEAAAGLLAQNGFSEIEQHRDLAGIVRVSGGRH